VAANPNDATFHRGSATGQRRPPRPRFFQRSKFDRLLTERNGRSSYVDEDAVEVMSPDGGTGQTYSVVEWFRTIENDFDYAQWIHGFKAMYRDWKEAHKTEGVQGTHISNWPLLSPGQVETLLAAGIKTIEQVSTMPDEIAVAVEGGAYVRSKARYWLNAANDIGGVTAEAASLRADNETLRAAIAHKDEQLAEVKAEVKRLTDYFTGKEGFDVVSGRVQVTGLQSVHAAGPRAAAQQAPAAAPPVQQQLPEKVVLSYDDAKTLSMPELREYCYERNIKPGDTAEKTLEALLAAGEVTRSKAPSEEGRSKRK
jgi:hypothetical protein